jgi:ceramide glucosyltransferase
VVSNLILGALAALSLLLLLWQWAVAARFPLHRRVCAHSFPPAVTLLKPLKGCDPSTEDCLRSWLAQDFTGRVQILFGVSSAEDPVCAVVRRLLAEFPKSEAQLVVSGPLLGANAKVSKLVELEALARHEILIISDADVRVPPDFLACLVEPLREPSVGLVNCFYRLANPMTLAMHCEAVAINADFWSQVLQARSLKPLDFALGAVMATRRTQLAQIGGFRALVDCLADDYQLGNRIARHGHGIALCPVVVECWEKPLGWAAVWKHQLRWARTIRVCQPAPYFFSILSNATLWPLLWLLIRPGLWPLLGVLVAVFVRLVSALDLQRRLNRSWTHARYFWMAPIKDLFQAAIWVAAFAGNRVEWRGERLKLRSDGTLVKL